jgi:hypothetical protein
MNKLKTLFVPALVFPHIDDEITTRFLIKLPPDFNDLVTRANSLVSWPMLCRSFAIRPWVHPPFGLKTEPNSPDLTLSDVQYLQVSTLWVGGNPGDKNTILEWANVLRKTFPILERVAFHPLAISAQERQNREVNEHLLKLRQS